MRARFNLFTCQRLGDNWRIGWLNGDRDKIGLTFGAFNVAADASQRTASPNASNKYINLTVGIFPDLRTGGLFVNFRVCRIAELLQQQVFLWIAGDNFFCFFVACFKLSPLLALIQPVGTGI